MIAKPLIIDKSTLDWDTLELLEEVQSAVQAGETPKFKVLKRLVGGLFVDWTPEDAGKITAAETAQIFEAVRDQLALPKASATEFVAALDYGGVAPFWADVLLAAEAWGVPPWAIDPRPTPRITWFLRWRFLTRERNLRANRKDGDPPPPADDWDDWE